ncbi:MAG TPA: hypothetical protein VGH61_07210 [Steroidobacteraceae bacterium]
MPHKWLIALTLVALEPGALPAQPPAPDTAEPGSIEEIASATTEARFLSPWVAYLPASATVVSPRSFLHRIPGAAGELVDTGAAYGYCRALAGSSARVRLFTIGRSEEGRDIVLLAIADEQASATSSSSRRRPRRWRIRAAPIRRLPSGSSAPPARSTTSTRGCTPTRPGPPSRLSSSPIAWRFRSNR